MKDTTRDAITLFYWKQGLNVACLTKVDNAVAYPQREDQEFIQLMKNWRISFDPRTKIVDGVIVRIVNMPLVAAAAEFLKIPLSRCERFTGSWDKDLYADFQHGYNCSISGNPTPPFRLWVSFVYLTGEVTIAPPELDDEDVLEDEVASIAEKLGEK